MTTSWDNALLVTINKGKEISDKSIQDTSVGLYDDIGKVFKDLVAYF